MLAEDKMVYADKVYDSKVNYILLKYKEILGDVMRKAHGAHVRKPRVVYSI